MDKASVINVYRPGRPKIYRNGVVAVIRRIGAGWLLLGSALILAALGVLRGELQEVFIKAATICLECIGLR